MLVWTELVFFVKFSDSWEAYHVQKVLIQVFLHRAQLHDEDPTSGNILSHS